ncbi:MAG TPA: HEAT repeat domain-containing protein, partial [Planctomycetota bacterium]|nr:HEAT repeat domain-containing protein [Planctomycetota bacterium]
MDDVLTKLGGFVSSSDSRLACAAAVILAELAPRNPAIVRELIKGLDHPDPVRRQFIIEALGRIGTAESAAALVPLIKAGGQSSELALRAIAHTASTALKPLLQLIGTVPPALLERIAECVGRTGEAVAFSSLLEHLQGADVEVCRAIRGGLRTAMTTFDDRSKENLRKQLEKGFQDKTLTSQHSSLIALLKISGDLGHIGLQKYLFDRIEPDEPVHVRRAALQAIARLHYTGEQRARQATRLLPLMLESDIANIAETALEAARAANQEQLGSENGPILRKLLNSPSSRIREFAMQTLATQSSSRTLNELIACLDNPDRAIREEALSALSRAPSAAAPLAERLLEIKTPEGVQEVSRALQPQAAQIPPRLLSQFADTYVSHYAGQRSKDAEVLRTNEERRRALLAIFRAIQSTALADAALEQAGKLRRKGDEQKA